MNTIRLLLLAQSSAGLFLYGCFMGVLLSDVSWLHRILMAALFAILTFGVSAQYKLLKYDVPADKFSYFGVGGYALLIGALVWWLWRRRTTDGGA